ncbi:pyridoxal phosphate-dependent aminotransferase [Ginsengibacter hankyongi]|uniref:Pyridoxal phosphate-dependent aminotransferase n=1 Tax=Ginsengibacter hankyongi TaxID=2607284 RepID=A0A5J5IP10_9BACT|nr:pyridoxal phosphate-dependent aminotransferase [Ginsengibacter hankyongi]KAA9042063.1 pyridoxal phosphate-dependent aminotransferase [Ginsengibacter hankyongi]
MKVNEKLNTAEKRTLGKLSNLSETLIGSEIVKLGADIKEKITGGETIYNFTIGDFDSSIFPIPKKLEEEIVNAYHHGFTTYPPADGILSLRESVSSFIKEREGLDYNSKEILIAAGGRPLIYALYRAVVDRDDKVIYAVPSWNNNHYVHFVEGQHEVIETTAENNFMPTAEDIQPHIEDAVLIALCSPLNPTGTVFKKEELEKICDMVLEENMRRGDDEKKLYFMYDQMYWTLTFGDTKHYNPVSLRPEMKQYTIFIDGISKAFAATGVRVGWALGPENVLAKMKAINSHIGAWSPMAEQHATAKFLLQKDVIDKYLSHFKKELEERLQLIYKGFQKLKAEGFTVDACAPQAAIYLTIQISLAGKKTNDGKMLSNQADVTSYVLNEAKLAVVPFYAFGAPKTSDWYRLSVGTCKKEEIPAMLEQLNGALSKLS